MACKSWLLISILASIATAMPSADNSNSYAFRHFKRRQVVIDKRFRWPNRRIPYEVALNIDNVLGKTVQSAIDEFNSKACVQWSPRKKSDRNFVLISFDFTFDDCTCEIGAPARPKLLKLSRFCDTDRGLLMRELMHCIGILDEQTRDDRDEYVKINWQKVTRGKERVFQLASQVYPGLAPQLLGLPYDYNSLTHLRAGMYSGKTTHVDGYVFQMDLPIPEAVIEAKHPSPSVGHADTFTELDLKKIAAYYECSGATAVSSGGAGGGGPITESGAGLQTQISQSQKAASLAPTNQDLNKNQYFSAVEGDAESIPSSKELNSQSSEKDESSAETSTESARSQELELRQLNDDNSREAKISEQSDSPKSKEEDLEKLMSIIQSRMI